MKEVKEILQPIALRTKEFLEDDMSIKVLKYKMPTQVLEILKYEDTATIIRIKGSLDFMIAVTYSNILLDNLVQVFLDGDSIGEYGKTEIYESVSMEIANIVIGNALENPDKTPLTISTPIFIYEAKSLSRSKSANTLVSTISTEYGNVSIFAIY